MTRRSLITSLAVVVGILAGMWWSKHREGRGGSEVIRVVAPSPSQSPGPGGSAPGEATSKPGVILGPGGNATGGSAMGGGAVETRITLADELNAENGTVRRDLEIIEDILAAWRSNFPRYGNPVGENEEITDLLTGNNSLHLALIPKNHPAVNAEGRLCDRWGTPFRFHQLAGDRMELRSAGLDQKFGTPDDAVLTP